MSVLKSIYSVNTELKSRFDHYVQTGDDSRIVNDLLGVVFSQAVKLGGREEYDAVHKILDKPKTPTAASAAMMAVGATENQGHLEETYEYIMSKSRDQDVSFCYGLNMAFLIMVQGRIPDAWVGSQSECSEK